MSKNNGNKQHKELKGKQPTIEEASVQIYKLRMIQWIKLKETDRNYQKDAQSEVVGDVVITTNGTLEECIALARREYPNSIITEIEIYNPKKETENVK